MFSVHHNVMTIRRLMNKSITAVATLAALSGCTREPIEYRQVPLERAKHGTPVEIQAEYLGAEMEPDLVGTAQSRNVLTVFLRYNGTVIEAVSEPQSSPSSIRKNDISEPKMADLYSILQEQRPDTVTARGYYYPTTNDLGLHSLTFANESYSVVKSQ